ncbi:MAG: amino acid ABC transporter permease [Acidimicrobiales bacterium]|nr:amino acid ABC transporter permease [Acidimicrobiales bacterium]HJL90891.1 amino acid ABC transporter permease [Acidimicrobiales bacterium]
MNSTNSTSQDLINSDSSTELANNELPPKVAALSPTEWLKANLFSNTFNSILTVLSTAAILLIIRGLLSFIFNPLRQWSATATNMRLLMTQAYPEHQYVRVWVSLGFLLFLTGISLAFWRAGRRVQLSQVGKRLLILGAFIVLATLLAPFSNRATIIWLIVGILIVGIGLLLKPSHEDKTISSLTLLSGAFLLAILSLWVIPYGHHSYLSTRTPKILAESGTVAMTTKLPWTIMFLVAVCSYFLGSFVREKIDEAKSKALLSVTWLISPLFLLFLVLRDPDFDTRHLFSTDVPIFLFFSIVGSVLLLWLTKPDVGEKGRVISAAILFIGFATFLFQMLMIVRILTLVLAFFALAAPTFSGQKPARIRYTKVWIASMVILCWLITAINTPSTAKVPGDFFIGGFAITLMIFFFTMVLAFPLGVLLALARTSKFPIFRMISTTFIEFIRGVPLITILIFFSVMVPLFLPDGMDLTEIAAVTIAFIIFEAAYLAENVRGGLQSVTQGQHEAAEAVGMTNAQKTVFIVLPQALRVAIPPMVGQIIATFKETGLLAIIGIFDFLYIARSVIPGQTQFMGSTRENLLFVSLVYLVICFSMSKASQRVEKRVGLGER